ncbi:MAG: hypothetical protein M1544_01230 [Candidatus Marsarchaeota archaeon]|nr:hypothetical protein [Candidatus Marsarchaeota archaeon]
MEYIVRGKIRKTPSTKFELRISAQSEKHAREAAIVKIGAKQGLKKNLIEVKEVVEAK